MAPRCLVDSHRPSLAHASEAHAWPTLPPRAGLRTVVRPAIASGLICSPMQGEGRGEPVDHRRWRISAVLHPGIGIDATREGGRPCLAFR